MRATDHEYYRRRERQERARAADCRDATARRAHLEMAHYYSALLLVQRVESQILVE